MSCMHQRKSIARQSCDTQTMAPHVHTHQCCTPRLWHLTYIPINAAHPDYGTSRTYPSMLHTQTMAPHVHTHQCCTPRLWHLTYIPINAAHPDYGTSRTYPSMLHTQTMAPHVHSHQCCTPRLRHLTYIPINAAHPDYGTYPSMLPVISWLHLALALSRTLAVFEQICSSKIQ